MPKSNKDLQAEVADLKEQLEASDGLNLALRATIDDMQADMAEMATKNKPSKTEEAMQAEMEVLVQTIKKQQIQMEAMMKSGSAVQAKPQTTTTMPDGTVVEKY